MFSFALLYLFYLFVPGLLIAHAAGVGRQARLLCLPLSYLLLVVNIFTAKATGSTVVIFFWMLNLQVVLVFVGLLWRWHRTGDSIGRAISRTGASALNWCRARTDQVGIAAASFVLLGVYLFWVGPYTEVPADFWLHAGSIQHNYLSLIEQQTFPQTTGWQDLVGKQAEYWYAIPALFCFIAGIPVDQSFAPLAFINSLLVLFAVFVITLLILRHSDIPARGRYIIAAIATGFFLTTFGTNVFSFVRYYTFAPALLNYVLYLIFAALMLEFLGRSVYPKWVDACCLFALLALMAVVHLQEAVFAVVLGGAMLFYTWFRVVITRAGGFEGSSEGAYRLTRRQLDWLFYLAIGLLVLIIMVARIKFERHDPLAFRRMIDLGQILPFVRHMYILDPQRQFYEALTPWGFLVMLLFVLHWRRFAASPFLVAGMLSPFYTVLNPVFTDFFLRFSWPELIWRFLYMVPTAIAAALIVYQCAGFVVARQHVVKAVYGFTVISLLLVLLLPLNTTYFYSPFSKYQTLKKVSDNNDHRVWGDLYTFLRTLEQKRNVLTDPVTGYTLRALTQHNYQGAKFHTIHWGGFKRYNFKHYSLDRYRQYDGWLFVINQRDGALSETGKISHHWHEARLEVHRNYRGGLIEFVDANPAVFRKIWSQDQINVFMIEFDE